MGLLHNFRQTPHYDTVGHPAALAFFYFKGTNTHRYYLPAAANNRGGMDSGRRLGSDIIKRSKGQQAQRQDCKGHQTK